MPTDWEDRDFLEDVYDARNGSRMQEKVADLRPFPVSVVYWQRRDHDLDDAREHFREMADVGITGLKGIHLQDDADCTLADVRQAAIDEGLVPWFYGKGGWEPITDDLLEDLGIDADRPPEEIQAHPDLLAHQREYLRERVRREDERPSDEDVRTGEPPALGLPFDEAHVEPFAAWLREEYGSLEDLRRAWFDYRGADSDLGSWEAAARDAALAEVGQGHGDFRRHVDAMRYAAAEHAAEIEALVEARLAFDPEEPQRTGGHQLFYNQADYGWDLEQQASAMAPGGSFYNSIHLVHHFDGMGSEVDLPVYVQARLTNDFFKGG